MKLITLEVLLTMTLFGACTDIDLPTGTPNCLENKIKELKKSTPCKDASVDEYEFQDATIFVLNTGNCCCDQGSAVLDNECNQIGSLGGLNGNTKINGAEFSSAKYIRTIWDK